MICLMLREQAGFKNLGFSFIFLLIGNLEFEVETYERQFLPSGTVFMFSVEASKSKFELG